MISKTKIKTKCKTPIEQIKSVDTITSRIPININSYTKDKIKYFFTHYKDLEGKKVDIGQFMNKKEAVKIFENSVKRYYCKHE